MQIVRLAAWAVILVAVAAAGAMLVPSLMGMQRFVLVGPSMTGTINKGSLVYDEIVPTKTLKRGDIITFVPPGNQRAVTHRIYSIRKQGKELVYRTKGDHNPGPDVWHVTLPQKSQAKFKFAIPHLGWLFILLAAPQHRFIALGIPVLLIALFNLAKVIRDVRHTRRIQHVG